MRKERKDWIFYSYYRSYAILRNPNLKRHPWGVALDSDRIAQHATIDKAKTWIDAVIQTQKGQTNDQ